MGISIDKASRQTLIFFALIAMLLGLFCSRILLSAGMIFFLFLTCAHQNILQQLKFFIRNPFLVGMSFLFFIPFVSGLWSSDKTEWLHWIRIKLPLFFLPVAFAGGWQLSKKRWLQLACVFLLLVFSGAAWSIWQYLQQTGAIQAAYLKAKTLDVPLQNDHVRFSWMVCVAVIVAVYLTEKIHQKTAKLFLVSLSVFFIAYLHILSARTGLFCLYFFGAFIVFRWLFSKANKLPGIGLLVIILLMPLLAWFFFPTFQNRIRYIVYDFSYIKSRNYLQGANDGTRIFSLQAGWNILQENALGVGAGDVIGETKKWYDVHVPQMIEADKIYPSSEWILYGDAAGWPGIILFTLVMLIPLMEKAKDVFFWISLNILAALSFMFDVGLEVQFGVFLYSFIVLCWWKWSVQQPALQ